MGKMSKNLLFTALFVGGAAWAGYATHTSSTVNVDGGTSDKAIGAASIDSFEASGEGVSAQGRRGPSVTIKLPISTQGPPWPPSEVVDRNGDYILIGNALKEVAPGVINLVPNQAVIVDKNTVPTLDANGIEDSTNWFGATHTIKRNLDLRRGSPDLDIELYSLSFGPHTDGVTQSPRIPRIGDSPFNMNKGLTICRDTFPTRVQSTNYFRPSYPLQDVPVNGFQGDGVAYDAETGNAFDPQTASNDPACAATGCPGEDAVDIKRTKRITLGDWMKSDGTLRIQLTKPNRSGRFTHADFEITLKDMLPNSMYTVWAVRARQIPVPGVWRPRVIDPIATPNVIITDEHGRARAKFEVENPFPDPATDVRRMRIFGMSVIYHSDHSNLGACFSRFGAGVDVHAVFSTINSVPRVPGTLPELTQFVTVAPR